MELTQAPNPNSWHAKLVVKLGKKIRSDKHYSEAKVQEKRRKETAKLQKKNRRPATTAAPEVNELGERQYSVFTDSATLASLRRKRDDGDMLHRLAHHDSFDSLLDRPHMLEQLRDPYFDSTTQKRIVRPRSDVHERRVEAVPDELWKRIASFASPTEAANLTLSTKTLYRKLGFAPLDALNLPANKHYKNAFLYQFDNLYPGHLLCFQCCKYHKRINPGQEQLKIEFVKFPVFNCPKVKSSVLPRMRIAHGRELPYSFIQLATRHARYHWSYGVSHDTLSRRWKCKDSTWTHRTRYMIHDGRLLMRVVSQAYAPPARNLTETAERHILYDREEYTPFFSVCAHWKDGDLMKICKCMMSHVPAPPQSYRKQMDERGLHLSKALANPEFIVRGCDECRPARRCPECPTEYLVEIRMIEDTKDVACPFKHNIVVTRWSDLGDGSSPFTSPEYTAINGIDVGHEGTGKFDSFSNIGRRAVGGIFESNVSGAIPGRRLVSLNPKNKRLGEEGHGWY
ncbi:hypothetical protein CLAFUW4_00218 [Fulvia fulva]|uniref:Uncharacterized protein n=1 Tax=Passalora fulva TaxID=5499 RepID=A0A9Q8L6C9_PASFU|nr:uncharacterized protein CLAFUR5_00218 [Fulvia fulva]KAK4635560.1 hypothetical protein CLAFUR4_00218 [Fulvia fulva]KAK4638159.1 hypothetical protein CLAFUR0_00219 [Fulvia fulva]UJO11680.1 hypothetical protein CLAFUR5_00218 [Fulvia fulva]WPV09524.1 hypothetical protein CLAFUW4_00218 [Fulvia fulva]WPV24917.1 hypothetical protein CLAFUW7_00221 [Fulvia fulva]